MSNYDGRFKHLSQRYDKGVFGIHCVPEVNGSGEFLLERVGKG